MSVTFRPTPEQHSPGPRGARDDSFPGRAGEAEPALNVTNTNARALLRALGLLPELGADDVIDAAITGRAPDPISAGNDLEGECDSTDLLGRVDLALALCPPDAGVPGYALDSRTIDCGRRPGWLQDRLAALREIAVYAGARGRRVDWY